MKIVQISLENANELLKAFEKYETSLYPAESKHPGALESLKGKNIVFYGAKANETILAVGALEVFKNYGEIKGVFVMDTHRGKGLAKILMGTLEHHLTNESVRFAKLQIGILQYEALGLYRKLGYKECHAFGAYRPDALTVFMTKTLK